MSAQEDHDALAEWAEKLQLDEKETESYINSGMKRLGHVMRTIWEDAVENESGSGGGDFFSQRRQSSERRAPQKRVANGGPIGLGQYPNG